MLLHLIVRTRRMKTTRSATVAFAAATAASTTTSASAIVMCRRLLVAFMSTVTRIKTLIALMNPRWINGAVDALGIMNSALAHLPTAAQLAVLPVVGVEALVVELVRAQKARAPRALCWWQLLAGSVAVPGPGRRGRGSRSDSNTRPR